MEQQCKMLASFYYIIWSHCKASQIGTYFDQSSVQGLLK